MSGRHENEIKEMKKVQSKIKNSPWYLTAYYYTLQDKSYTTQKVYVNYVSDFLNFVDTVYKMDINDIDTFRKIKPSMINVYINSLNNTGDSIKNSRLYGIKSFFDFLINDEYIETNPCSKVKPRKNHHEIKITSLTKGEIEIIKNNIIHGCGTEEEIKRRAMWKSRDLAIVITSLSLGLRVTSLCEINVEDIDFENMEIKIVEKGNKTRYIKFGENLADIINDWLIDRDDMLSPWERANVKALFISRQRSRITSRSIENIVKKYTANIDKHITPHKLRSTCATNVYNKTGDIYLTANLLGHSNVATTRRYAQISEERKEKAAKAMDSILF